MHSYETRKGDAGVKFCQEALRLDSAQFDLDAVNNLDVFGTDIEHPGEDFGEFRVIDYKDKILAERREISYKIYICFQSLEKLPLEAFAWRSPGHHGRLQEHRMALVFKSAPCYTRPNGG